MYSLLGGWTEATGSLAITLYNIHALLVLPSCCCFNPPHVFRSLAVGSGSMVCRVGSIVAPLCVSLSSVWIFMPQVRIGL